MGDTFKGLEIELHRFAGARVLRVVHPGRQDIDEHRHDWAYIGLHTLGCYRETYDGGEAHMSGPSAVLHPAGRPHADVVGSSGLETLTIEFEMDWLRHHGFDGALDRSHAWQGGGAAVAGRDLIRAVRQPNVTESEIGRVTSNFLHRAFAAEPVRQPSWLDCVRQAMRDSPCSTATLARQLGLHPAWLARAYLHATGEGVHETSRRLRVERASSLLRTSDRSLADVAIATGFCDQSHMNRCFRAVLGRTPLQVRSERAINWNRASVI